MGWAIASSPPLGSPVVQCSTVQFACVLVRNVAGRMVRNVDKGDEVGDEGRGRSQEEMGPGPASAGPKDSCYLLDAKLDGLV